MHAIFEFEHSVMLLVALFFVALVAGLIDSIAGGGGLITIPVLYGILPPQAVLGTNKLQSSFGSGSAMFTFHRSGTVSLAESRVGILFTAVGAALGTVTVQRLDPALLRQLIPWLLAAIAVYMLMSPRVGLEDVHPRMARGGFFVLAGLGLGFYDGFFWAGDRLVLGGSVDVWPGPELDHRHRLHQGDEFYQQYRVAGVICRGRDGLLAGRVDHGAGAVGGREDRFATGGNQGRAFHPADLHRDGGGDHGQADLAEFPRLSAA